MREYKAIRALRAGQVLDLEGLRFRMAVDEQGVEKPIQAGDLYIAERNTGPQLLTALKVVQEQSLCGGYIIPTTSNYPYDLPECVKVVEA
jgi:hypothetical protein